MSATVAGVIVLNVLPGLLYIFGYTALANVRDPRGIPAIQLLFAQLVTYVPVGAFLVAMIPLLVRGPLSQVGVRRPSATDIRSGLLGALVMWLAVNGVGAAVASLLHRHDTESAVAILRDLKTPSQLTVFFLVACVFAPIIEELTFRVFIFNALTKRLSVIGAAIVSGLIFGAVHAIGSPPAQLVTIGVPLACGGVVLAYVYATTRCFWSNVTTHASFNAINVVALVFFHAS